jgi:KDO2-lipid IV(A) lauroyltransferase
LKILQYIFLYPLLLGISILPFKLLYILSDFLYFLGFILFKYRVALVRESISLAFPDKSNVEINSIVKKFYRNFFDITLESIKLLTSSKKEIRTRMRKGDMQVLEDYYKEGESVILAIGHVGNWELGAAAYAIGDYPHVKGIYKPQTNLFFNELMIRIRTRFGGDVYPMEETLNKIRDNMGNQTAIGLLADHNPSNHNAYWHHFLGRETPVFTSVEMLARRFDFPVVYLRFIRLGRGSYEMNCEVLAAKPKQTEKHYITHTYFRMLEQDIYAQPDNYLWTHNRWKRKKEDLKKFNK